MIIILMIKNISVPLSQQQQQVQQLQQLENQMTESRINVTQKAFPQNLNLNLNHQMATLLFNTNCAVCHQYLALNDFNARRFLVKFQQYGLFKS